MARNGFFEINQQGVANVRQVDVRALPNQGVVITHVEDTDLSDAVGLRTIRD